MDLFTLEQMEILMFVAGSQDPVRTAQETRGRWRYILGLARAAQQGLMLDENYPHVMVDADGYALRADRILSALDEWLTEQSRRSIGEL